MKSEDFIALHGDDPDWVKLREGHFFADDLRRALAGDPSGFREVALYAPEQKVKSRIIHALWMAGVPVRPHHHPIKRMWQLESPSLVQAFGEDLDRFLRDAGFSAVRLPDEFDVWRGGSEPIEEMACGRSWTYSYSAACAFALNNTLWRTAQGERWARELGEPEPLVIARHIRREHAVWIGGLEREVILTNEALALPALPYGSLRNWRRHRARKQEYVSTG